MLSARRLAVAACIAFALQSGCCYIASLDLAQYFDEIESLSPSMDFEGKPLTGFGNFRKREGRADAGYGFGCGRFGRRLLLANILNYKPLVLVASLIRILHWS